MTPLVSLVIPARNAATTIEECVATCCAQTYPSLEIVLVDDGSTDDTVERAVRVAEAARRALRVVSTSVRGAGNARNQGYAASSGDYIAWIDADDGIHPEKITEQVTALRTQNACFAWSDYLLREERHGRPRTTTPRPVCFSTDALAGILLGWTWAPPAAWLLTRAAADRLAAHDGFRNGVRTEIREYASRASLLGLKMTHVPRPLAFYRAWSDAQQLSLNRPRLSWSLDFRTSFAALRALAERLGIRLTGAQRALLEQRWETLRWRTVEGLPSASAPFSLVSEGVMPRDVSMAEAAIVGATAHSRGAFTLESLVFATIAARPHLSSSALILFEAACDLLRGGFFERAAPADGDTAEVAARFA